MAINLNTLSKGGSHAGRAPLLSCIRSNSVHEFFNFNGLGECYCGKAPGNLIKAITNYKPTFAPLVPTMYINILKHPDVETADMTSVRACFSGSAPMPVEVIKEFEEKTDAVILEVRNITQKDLIDYCAGKLAKYKLPTKVEFRESLPKSAVGKILKRELKVESVCV